MNMIEMVKQAHAMRKLQKELEAKTVEVKSKDGLISVVARGDMSVKLLTIDPQAIDPAKADRLAQAVMATVNSALDEAKKAAAADMAKHVGSLGQFLGGKG
jgi:DNA-binding YbaB/EbfC family protein